MPNVCTCCCCYLLYADTEKLKQATIRVNQQPSTYVATATAKNKKKKAAETLLTPILKTRPCRSQQTRMLFLTMKALFDVEPYLPHGHKWVIPSTAMKSQTQRLFIWCVLSWMLHISLLTYGFTPTGKMLAHLISPLNMWRWSRRCLKWPAHFTPPLPVLFIPLLCLSALFLSGPSAPSISPTFISHHFIPAAMLLPLTSLFLHTFPFVSIISYLPICAYLHLFCFVMAAVKCILDQLLTAPSAAELDTNFHPKLKCVLHCVSVSTCMVVHLMGAGMLPH